MGGADGGSRSEGVDADPRRPVTRHVGAAVPAVPIGGRAPLQTQIGQLLAAAVAQRALLPGDPVRAVLAQASSCCLGVARNTVVLAYRQLVDYGVDS